jgi:Na+/proline symporter
LVATATVVEDFYSRALGRKTTQESMVRLSRYVTIGVGIGGFLLAISTQDLIYKMVSYAWSGLGSSFGPSLLLALHWKRVNAAGIIAGMITGALTTIIWSEIPEFREIVSERVVSFVFATAAVVIGTLAGKPHREASPV